MKKKILALILALLVVCTSVTAFAEDTRNNTVQLTATVDESTPSITLNWPYKESFTDKVVSGHGIKIYKDGNEIANLDVTATSYTDTDVQVGVLYDYKVSVYAYNSGTSGSASIKNSTIVSGIALPEVEDKGILILLIENTYIDYLADRIDRLEEDLVCEGWTVKRLEASRDEKDYQVKEKIKEIYNQNPEKTKALFILGHIAVPKAGSYAPDGHHSRPQPADNFYADMDGEWTDTQTQPMSASSGAVKNNPGDGVWDTLGGGGSQTPSKVELEYGRVDFYNLPVFAPLTEKELLARYLDKNHKFRRGNLQLPVRAILQDGFNRGYAATGFQVLPSLVGGSSKIIEEDYLTSLKADGYLWSYIDGPGQYTSLSYTGAYSTPRNGIRSADLANNILKTNFAIMFGSYTMEWDYKDNLLRSFLAMPGYGLYVIPGGSLNSTLKYAGMGYNMGYSVKLAANGSFENGIITASLGDPTLTVYPSKSVDCLYVDKFENKDVVKWNTYEKAEAYYVYGAETKNGPYTKLGEVKTSYYVDKVSESTYYMVRPLIKETTASGSFFKLATGSICKNEEMLSVKEVSFTDSVKALDEFPEGLSELDAKVLVSNKGDADKDVMVILAVFDKEHTLKQSTIAKTKIPAKEEAYAECGFTIEQNAEGYYAKVFVWENSFGLKALTSPEVLPAKEVK